VPQATTLRDTAEILTKLADDSDVWISFDVEPTAQ
jgi:hypothetical protein